MKTKIKIIITSIFLLVFFLNLTYAFYQKQEVEKIKQELQKVSELKLAKIKQEKLKNNLEKLRQDYQKQVWLTRCLEIKQELEIKQIQKNLSCKENLENFASYNLHKTKESLGL